MNPELLERASRIRMLLMDVDGVLTNAQLYNIPGPDGKMWETKGFDAQDGIALTEDFLTTLYGTVTESVSKGRSLKETYDAARRVMDPKFSSFAIYEHCMPFNVSRAYDEAKGISYPVIWTAERDRAMWAALRG